MLSVGLVKRGHKATVITTVPHYPSGQVSAAFRGRKAWKSSEDGVGVIRVPLPSLKRANLSKRLLQFFCYQLFATWIGLGQKYDVALVANPALWVWLPFAWLVAFRQRPAVFSIHDVYPDVGVELGIFRHRPIIKAVASMERFCLNRARIIRILSDSFRPGLRMLGVPNDKMALVYDWVDTDLIRPLSRDNAFSRGNNLNDFFVILYAGNLGLSQGLEHVLTAAEQLADQPDLRFVFVGDGAARGPLQAEAGRRQLKNVIFLPFQPRNRLPEVLATADVSLVILRQGIGTASLPSKTFSILASGRPILASVEKESETWNLVKRAQAGLCVPPEQPSDIADAILVLLRDKRLREELGLNGRAWAERYHSPRSAAEQIENLLFRASSAKEGNTKGPPDKPRPAR
jgi:colanic acid biosynthesis glycosyl transferase WcaI